MTTYVQFDPTGWVYEVYTSEHEWLAACENYAEAKLIAADHALELVDTDGWLNGKQEIV